MSDAAGINIFLTMAASTGILHKKQSRTFVLLFPEDCTERTRLGCL
jgi:hypothetical protein